MSTPIKPHRSIMEVPKIVGMSILAAVIYGIIHDQITAHVCVEYFTLGHPDIFGTNNPILLGLGWGVIATWWVGLLLGIPLAIAARVGRRPKLTARDILPNVVKLMLVCGLLALTAGLLSYALGHTYPTSIDIDFMRYNAVARAHEVSYASGFIGGIVVCVKITLKRKLIIEYGANS